ncbi:MAG TPA: HAMP domain-containing histidine kinase [Candidatus Hungatella pullicola]|nr:HAMP domain-containing histidine kinase [Candidatus Hungatella pullicola]
MKEIKRLRFKFIASNMVMVTLVIALAFFAIGYFTKNRIEQNNRDLLGQVASNGMVPQFFEGGMENRIPYFTITIDGNHQVTMIEGQYNIYPDDEFLERLAMESIRAAEDQGIMDRYRLRYMRMPFESGYKISYLDTSIEDAFATNMWRALGIIGFLAWLVFFGVSWLLSKWAVYPVGESIRREKQFVADASHELKTPLTVIMANAQLLSGQSGADEKDTRRWTANIQQEAKEMKKLVEEMLLLAKNEACHGESTKVRCNFSDIVIETVLSFESVFYQMNKDLSSNVEEDIYVWGEENQLTKLLRILLDNAGKYSSENGSIRVTLNRMGKKRLKLCVSNTGDPIPEDKKKEIFQRFYRGDGSRSDKKGYGLGLAIAKTIADNHKASLYVESEDGINSFYLEMSVGSRLRDKIDEWLKKILKKTAAKKPKINKNMS